MTEAIAALAQLCHVGSEVRERALSAFFARYQRYPLVIDKWFAVQALSRLPDTTARVRSLTEHAEFDLHNPNRVRALISTFAQANPEHFHSPDGGGYALLSDYVSRIDRFNPLVAARMVAPLGRFSRYVEPLRDRMVEALQEIANSPQLSRDLREQVGRALEASVTPRTE